MPPPLPWRALGDDDVVCGLPDYPIIWLPGTGDELICSTNGHGFSITAHPNIIRLLERLNSGTAYCVKNLIEEYTGDVREGDIEFTASAEEVRTMLEKLYSLRAINLCS